MDVAPPPSLGSLFGVFLRLGFISFGGPAAHIALMEQQLVTQRGWLTRERFLDMLAITNLIPGPNSTELALYIGHTQRGLPGLLAAAFGFIAPSAFLTGILAWIYLTCGELPAVDAVFAGLHPVVIALIAIAAYRLLRKAITTRLRAAMLMLVIALHFAGLSPVVALLTVGLVHVVAERLLPAPDASACLLPPLLFANAAIPTTLGLFGSFLKIGFLLFGSGYVLLPYLQSEFQGVLPAVDLTNAIAAGQITPGPILCAATFVGLVLQGWSGAALATLGIFLPAMLMVAAVHPLIPHLKKSRACASFLKGAAAGSVGLIFTALFDLGKVMMVTSTAWILAAIALGIMLWKPKLSPAWLMAGGALMGWLLQQI